MITPKIWPPARPRTATVAKPSTMTAVSTVSARREGAPYAAMPDDTASTKAATAQFPIEASKAAPTGP
ncbi:hypothetical protein GCM10009551_053380 [Nocardiopsis tropica]